MIPNNSHFSIMGLIETKLACDYDIIKLNETKGLKFDRIYMHPGMFTNLLREICDKYQFLSYVEVMIDGQTRQVKTLAIGGFEFKICPDSALAWGELVLGFSPT